MPTFKYFKGGIEVDVILGAVVKVIEEKIQKHL